MSETADTRARPDGLGSQGSAPEPLRVSAEGADPSRWVKQLPRAFRAFGSVLGDRLFLNLPARLRPLPANDLDDRSLAKWARWVVANSARVYAKQADEEGRSVTEVTAMHGVISLALLTLATKAEHATFEVRGVTFRGEAKGDWRVTIEQVSDSDGSAERRDAEGGSIGAADDSAGPQGHRPYPVPGVYEPTTLQQARIMGEL